MRINGIGTTLLGVKPDDDGTSTATLWFTFLFLPLVPIKRMRVKFMPHSGSGFSYVPLAEGRLAAKEVFTTYFFGLIVGPIIAFGPMIVAIREVWEGLGLPEPGYTTFVFASIAWFVVALLVIMSRLERRCRPPKQES